MRRYNTSHSLAGFELRVTDHPAWRLAVGHGVERLMGLLGHPCCGRGLGRIRGVDGLAHRALSWALNVGYRNRRPVVELPITTAQAVALRPEWVEDLEPDGWITVDGPDHDGDLYRDGRLVSVLCPGCNQQVAYRGRTVLDTWTGHGCTP